MAEIDPEEHESLEAGARALVKLGESLARRITVIEEVLTRVLSEITSESITTIRWSFTQLLDVDASYFLMRYLSSEEPDEVLSVLTAGDFPPHTIETLELELRRLQVLYGHSMERALRLWNTEKDDWASSVRDLQFDIVTQRYVIRAVITKYSGEQLQVVMDPDSLLNLTSTFLNTLNAIPTEVAYDVDYAGSFRTEVDLLLAKLDPPKAPAEPDLPAATAVPATD